ncbi:MAG: hypothetical protein M3X11_13150 [Acidobacteriota bacterium]|nr:hypothetical protein [Acidobacteriota bacterium]
MPNVFNAANIVAANDKLAPTPFEAAQVQDRVRFTINDMGGLPLAQSSW